MPEAINLDCSTDSDLARIAEMHENDAVRTYAKRLLGAREARLACRIEAALKHERLLEVLYLRMPAYLRW